VEGLGHGDREALSRVARDAVQQLMDGGSLDGPWKTGLTPRPTKEQIKNRKGI
jgi:hypothetical protein